MAIGGRIVSGTPLSALTELWNGSSWTEVNDTNTARKQGGASGLSTSAMYFNGTIPPGFVANAESWNGTNWTTVANMGSARYRVGGAGTNNTSAASFGGI